MTAAKKVELSGFDKIKQAQEEGLAVDILDPTGSPIGVTIRVAGPDSDRFRKAREKQIDSRIELRQGTPMKAAQHTLESVTFLAEVTIDWTEMSLDGRDYPCTKENALALYQRFPWMAEQLDEKCAVRRLFMKSSAKSSESSSDPKQDPQTLT